MPCFATSKLSTLALACLADNPCDCKGNTNRSYCADDNNPLMPNCHTYEDTLLQVHAYAEAAGIPYRWWLIDSWWHAFDNGDYFEDVGPIAAVLIRSRWPSLIWAVSAVQVPAQVGQLFPHGLAWLYKQLGEQTFGAHWSSSFSAESPYVREFSPGGGWLPSSPNGVRAAAVSLDGRPHAVSCSHITI